MAAYQPPAAAPAVPSSQRTAACRLMPLPSRRARRLRPRAANRFRSPGGRSASISISSPDVEPIDVACASRRCLVWSLQSAGAAGVGRAGGAAGAGGAGGDLGCPRRCLDCGCVGGGCPVAGRGHGFLSSVWPRGGTVRRMASSSPPLASLGTVLSLGGPPSGSLRRSAACSVLSGPCAALIGVAVVSAACATGAADVETPRPPVAPPPSAADRLAPPPAATPLVADVADAAAVLVGRSAELIAVMEGAMLVALECRRL